MRKPALQGVVLLNLGSPEKEENIPGYIRSLLSDPQVVPLPWPFRPMLASWVALKRSKTVTEHYRLIGGRSPLSAQTRAQVEALRTELGGSIPVRYVFRHSAPFAGEVLPLLAGSGARRIIALPVYPQWSRSTSGSSILDLESVAQKLQMEVRPVPAFPDAPGYIDALIDLTRPLLTADSHVLISAHGLPMRLIESGDPYLADVHKTVNALRAKLPPGIGCSLAFQSRVGRMEWTGPYLQEEIKRLSAEGCRSLVIIPISFVCENLETAYELDIELAALARECGFLHFRRVPTPGCHPLFISALARLVHDTAGQAGWEVAGG